ncbi:MAG: T9SS type A sorting domain-containing protein, partial [Candidatus Zixiibacteriota bacterium]
VTADESGMLAFHEKIILFAGERPITPKELVPRENLIAPVIRPTGESSATGSGSTIDYVIITSATLADAFAPLAKYKSETGYNIEIRLVEEIVSSYDGRDDAERLREYLKEFYDQGGEYVLLGGDEINVPVRYAYHLNAYSEPALDRLQICDLYFADLTGKWDVDDDGIWGEPYHDQPDLVPELLVGRLPFGSPEEIQRYTHNLITYETDPGHGDRDYISRVFFFSSDQMRDYAGGGQHSAIAAAYPGDFQIDTVTGVECASGDDPAPSNISPTLLAEPMSPGFGMVNVVAHGRPDGFVVKSPGYSDTPKELLLTHGPVGLHGGFDELLVQDKPTFYYSLACASGGFDYDQPPIEFPHPNMAQHLLASDGGAVGVVANSRWGWVGSSYLLQTAFYEHLFANPDEPAVRAMVQSKLDYYYVRDVVYGQNFLGDPSLKLYTARPAKSSIELTIDGDTFEAFVSADGREPGVCRIIVSDTGGVVIDTATDVDGYLLISYPFDPKSLYRVSTVRTNMTVSQVSFIGSVVTSVEDADRLLPRGFSLAQNYPNPFNPSTIIEFEIPRATTIKLNLFNCLGQEVAVLADGVYPAGQNRVEWKGLNSGGEPVATGVYFYRLETGSRVATRKMLLLR